MRKQSQDAPRRFRLDMKKNFFMEKGGQALKQAAQGGGEVPISGGIAEVWMWH